ncbi:hypothetical protein PanWU01x14_105920, partial [Parasponia andersonii]
TLHSTLLASTPPGSTQPQIPFVLWLWLWLWLSLSLQPQNREKCQAIDNARSNQLLKPLTSSSHGRSLKLHSSDSSSAIDELDSIYSRLKRGRNFISPYDFLISGVSLFVLTSTKAKISPSSQ